MKKENQKKLNTEEEVYHKGLLICDYEEAKKQQEKLKEDSK